MSKTDVFKLSFYFSPCNISPFLWSEFCKYIPSNRLPNRLFFLCYGSFQAWTQKADTDTAWWINRKVFVLISGQRGLPAGWRACGWLSKRCEARASRVRGASRPDDWATKKGKSVQAQGNTTDMLATAEKSWASQRWVTVAGAPEWSWLQISHSQLRLRDAGKLAVYALFDVFLITSNIKVSLLIFLCGQFASLSVLLLANRTEVSTQQQHNKRLFVWDTWCYFLAVQVSLHLSWDINSDRSSPSRQIADGQKSPKRVHTLVQFVFFFLHIQVSRWGGHRLFQNPANLA